MPEQHDLEALLPLLQRMLVIRRTEESLIRLREREDLVRGHYHVYIGQEATAVAVCDALAPQDLVFTTHRNHGHILARGGEPEPLVAEILGRRTGYNGGRGGTLHPVVPAKGILHTSAIVGGSLPVATGAALSARLRRSGQVVVAFFGDGALEEGAVYEALNMAVLWKVPLVLICENNSIPPELRRAGQYPSSTLTARQLGDVPAAFTIPTRVVDGADLTAMSAVAEEAVAWARGGNGPLFVEARTTRWPGNFGQYPADYGVETDLAWAWDASGVPAALVEWVATSDPLVLAARFLLEHGAASRERLLAMDGEVRSAVEGAVEAAKAAGLPDPETALLGVFAPEV